jgi:hypothetical protein
MKAHTPLKIVGSPVKVAMIPSGANPRPSTIPERDSVAAAAALPTALADSDDSARFREDIIRRYEAPFRPSWRHGGLND